MKDILNYVFLGTGAFILLFVIYFVEKNILGAKKLLMIQGKIFIPIEITFTAIKWYKTNEIFGPKNYFGLFLVLNSFILALLIITDFLSKNLIIYSMNNIYFDKRNYKYVLAIAIQVCNSIFCSLGTILFIINDFIIKLNFMN
ncbi:hypothetical protein [Clostridium sp. YIM B02506]|uniref:hypothetical protein n=1 Tax=Clostridium sp. YIM B02506 TaxID=2910680 RepID=UPI001EEDB6FC|nr:hypothetical protein [Clostridium sp. YIM B02506]